MYNFVIPVCSSIKLSISMNGIFNLFETIAPISMVTNTVIMVITKIEIFIFLLSKGFKN